MLKEYGDSIDITVMKTAKQEDNANISGLRRLCYGWIPSQVRMVTFFDMQATYVILLRFALRIDVLSGVMEV